MEDYESLLIEPEQEWQTVSYHKKNKKQSGKSKQGGDEFSSNWNDGDSSGDVFRSIEQHAEERRKRIVESQKLYEAASGESSAVIDKGEQDSDAEDGAVAENDGAVEKKSKPKKVKKPKVTVAEAAAKIDNSDLVVFLVDISVSCCKFEKSDLLF